MSIDPARFVFAGELPRKPPGWLSLHARSDADVLYKPGDDLPFEDRGVDVIASAAFVTALPRETRIRFLLECRRVLKPGGVLSLRIVEPADGAGAAKSCAADIAHVAALIGLDAASVAPISAVRRDALAQLPPFREQGVALEYSKRDRAGSVDPLVSIVIPAYSPRYFTASLDSALAQTYANIEIVVCDDSEGAEIEASTRARAGRRDVRYLRNEVRLHGRGNFTRCLESARGEFVKFLCDDDLLAPTCVASLLNAFRRASDITLATSHRRRIDESGRVLQDQPATWPIIAADATIAGYTLANVMLMAGLNIIGEPSTALIRRTDLLDQGRDYFRFNGVRGLGIIDMVMWTALLLKGDAVYLRESLSAFRIHAAQRQRDPASVQRNIASIRELQAAWLDLGLFEKVPPHLILAKPFPPAADSGWRLQPVLSPVAVRRVEPRA